MFVTCKVPATLVVAVASIGIAASALAGSCNGEHVVEPGDTLSNIANRCGTSVQSLLRANPRIKTPAQIAVGWRLSIPSDSAGSALGSASGAPVSLTGRIVNGRRCAMIETSDGQEYGLVSPELAFVNGAFVVASGQVVDDPSCTGTRTLMVDELRAAEPT